MNKTINQPPVSSMAVGGYKSANAVNPRGGYWGPSTIIAQIFDHKNGHMLGQTR